MDYTYEQLHGMTVAELRDVAAGIEHDSVQGATQMNKEHLLPAICTSLGIEAHAHHEVVGIDKSALKAKIGELKGARDSALESGDSAAAKLARRRIHRIKRKIRKATV
ncbi:MAG: hypothetical protein VYE73_03995 [Acidobacteriota bacterium]|nr:hypothetical protein [Acidobacteriota bacterium]